jgi:hypothetical protein
MDVDLQFLIKEAKRTLKERQMVNPTISVKIAMNIREDFVRRLH